MSEQLSERLAHMNLPQPERIFGPDDAAGDDNTEEMLQDGASRDGVARCGSESGKSKAKQGVTPDEWDKIKLEDEVPESVRTGRMTHSRNASRV
jgi:tryptophanyl-tRNA synthetase